MEQIFFDSWQPLVRTLVIGVLAYVGLIVLLRLSGKRTLSKMNAFDLVVTVALGSTLATVLLNKSVSLAQGLLAFALLIVMQFVVTFTSVRVPWVRKLVTGEPGLLLYQGEVLPDALRRARVTRTELEAAARDNGASDLSELHAVVLETDGSFSVLRKAATSDQSSLDGVQPPGPGDLRHR